MFTRKKEICKSMGIVAMLTLGTSSTLQADSLTQTQLHATIGIVTNFILSADTTSISMTHNGVIYGSVTSPHTGRVWLDRNLGALQVCTSFDDEDCYGDYYQWGRNADGHEKSLSNTTATLTNNPTTVGHGDFITSTSIPYDWTLVDGFGITRKSNWFGLNGASVCPLDFRVPSIAELNAELFDIGSAEIHNRVDAFNSFLKLPSAGTRSGLSGSFGSLHMWGYLWSGSVSGANAYSLSYNSINASVNGFDNRIWGQGVRCIKK